MCEEITYYNLCNRVLMEWLWMQFIYDDVYTNKLVFYSSVCSKQIVWVHESIKTETLSSHQLSHLPGELQMFPTHLACSCIIFNLENAVRFDMHSGWIGLDSSLSVWTTQPVSSSTNYFPLNDLDPSVSSKRTNVGWDELGSNWTKPH